MKLTDEEKVDEMILSDVDETHCPQQLVDVPVPQIAERIVEVVTQHITSANPGTSRCTDRQHVETHKVVAKIIKDSQSHAASCECTGSKDCFKTRSNSKPVNKS